jgi:hypothetical protein
MAEATKEISQTRMRNDFSSPTCLLFHFYFPCRLNREEET